MTAFLEVHNRTMDDILAVRRLPRVRAKDKSTSSDSPVRFVEQPTNLSIVLSIDGLRDLAGVT